MSSSLTFKLVTNRVPVVLESPDGAPTEYELREMTAALRDRYLDRLSERMRIDASGRPAGLKRYEGLQADLLSNCLYNAKSELVPAGEIQKWPAAVVGELFKAAQKLNHLHEEEKKEEPAKNASEVTS